MCNLINLKSLLLHDNELIGPIPQRLTLLKNLSCLSLYINSLTGTVPKCLTKLTKLNELHLSRNRLRGYIPKTPQDLLNNLHLLEDKSDIKCMPMGEIVEPEPIDQDVCEILQKPWTQRSYVKAELNATSKWLKSKI